MRDVPGPSKHFSSDNSSNSVAKKRRKINQDSSLDENDCSSEEAAYSQRNDEDQSDTSEGSGTSMFDIPHDYLRMLKAVEPGELHRKSRRAVFADCDELVKIKQNYRSASQI
ncbi:hypothetical protein EVAR_66971_1 [Eumeta japonica]|uniref:Uncharacterized protein n=1 Tax=Eumeta variegata TaxID=151549 RepID=A0A4C2A0P7_EUMVA|nr:hypothetical protein EVAR_66971_1 [Eumeta japonica]